MIRELTVLDLPPGLRHSREIPTDWEAGPLCSRQDVLSALSSLGHSFDRSRPERLRIDLALGEFLEVFLGVEELLFSFGLRFGSSENEARVVSLLLSKLGFQALEARASTGLFQLAPEKKAKMSSKTQIRT